MSHVRYFLAVCKEGTFTGAAKHCGVTQPSLTQAIKILEQELGGALFQRRRNGAELTEFGMALQRYFILIGRCVDDIQQQSVQLRTMDRPDPPSRTGPAGPNGRGR
jgi:LysR family transcriptional regulator, hydrogen peroxide-inducible genes activator